MLQIMAQHPRRIFAAVAFMAMGMLAFAVLFLQNIVGLQPCPMCIVQRECFIALGVLCAIAAISPKHGMRLAMALMAAVCCLLGAITAGRQSWLQWNPPEMASCGRDLYGIIESFPLQRIIPMIFRGGGDCSAVDWTLLGMTIANWSFIWFLVFGLTMLALAFSWRGEPQAAGMYHTKFIS